MKKKERSGEKNTAERFNWTLYDRLKRNASDLLDLGCDEFVQILVKEYGVQPNSKELEEAIRIWKQMRGIW